MTVVEWFMKNGEHWSDAEYGPNGWIFPHRVASDKRRGIYCFIEAGLIEKVGKAEQEGGIATRALQYMGSKRRLDRGDGDRSDALWDKVMYGELKGQTLQVYFYEVKSIPQSYDGVEVPIDGIRILEKNRSIQAREEGNPMRLSGKGN